MIVDVNHINHDITTSEDPDCCLTNNWAPSLDTGKINLTSQAVEEAFALPPGKVISLEGHGCVCVLCGLSRSVVSDSL